MLKFFICLFTLGSVGAAQAETWSGCETITGVSDYRQYNGNIYFTVTPAPAKCAPTGFGQVGGMMIKPGVLGATATSMNANLAMLLSAQLASKRVMLFYDNTTADCSVQIINTGGYAGQCP